MTVEIIGKRFGRLTVIEALPPKVYRKAVEPVVLCVCDCGNRVSRRIRFLGNYSSCGCFNHLSLARQAQTLRQETLRSTLLTREELDQVDRIVAERRRPSSVDRLDAIDCVIADRKVGEMICHGGETFTL